jgi:hypothetical protein
MTVERRLVKVSVSVADGSVSISSESVKTEDGRLILLGRGLKEIPHQTPVDVVAYYEDGVQFMWGVVTLSMPEQMNVDIVSAPSKRQERRESLKVRISFDAIVEAVYSTGRQRRRFNMRVPIRIRDLSMGGAGFFSNHIFFRKQRLMIDLGFLKPGLKVEFQVLRREKPKPVLGGDGEVVRAVEFRYRYGGRIVKLNADQEQTICEHVFKVQLQEHQKRKEAEGGGEAR